MTPFPPNLFEITFRTPKREELFESDLMREYKRLQEESEHKDRVIFGYRGWEVKRKSLSRDKKDNYEKI